MSADILYLAAFLAGFFGSTHCLGMCGAIVVLFEQQYSQGMGHWLRRVLYNLGRLSFYTVLGAIAGGAGAVIVATAGARTALIILRLLAGLLVIAIGLNLVFNWNFTRFLENAGGLIWKRLLPLARYVLPIGTPARALGAGFLWGALPCGLVYSAVAIAATSGGYLEGAAIMFCFWLGTAPALMLAGASAEKVQQWKSRTRLRQVAGVVVIVIGILALAPIRMLSH